MMINPEHYFYVSDGSVLKDINDFLEKMRNISESIFNHHVNSEKNDFANWTKDVLKDGKLSKSILKAKSAKDIVEAIERRLSSKEKMKNKKEGKQSLINDIKDAHS